MSCVCVWFPAETRGRAQSSHGPHSVHICAKLFVISLCFVAI